MSKIISVLYVTLLIVMGSATFVDHYYGGDVASRWIYGSWWFVLLWGAFASVGWIWLKLPPMKSAQYINREANERPNGERPNGERPKGERPNGESYSWSFVGIHVAFCVILLGAFITYLFAWQGMMHLREGEASDEYVVQEGERSEAKRSLDFTVTLTDFELQYYAGTQAAKDYVSDLEFASDGTVDKASVSMNKVYDYRGIRFTQASYDADGKGTILSLNSDPGKWPTYFGYGLLFLSLLASLFDPKGKFRQVLKNPALKKGVLTLSLPVFSLFIGTEASAAPQQVVNEETAEAFGDLWMDYNSRICPVETFAQDVLKKLYGKPKWEGMNANRVMLSYALWPDLWDDEKLIKVKSAELREYLGIDKTASLNDFYAHKAYRLGPLVREYFNENRRDALHQAALDMDDRVQLLVKVREGQLFKLFPQANETGHVNWYSGTQTLPREFSREEVALARGFIDMLRSGIATEQDAQVLQLLRGTKDYQARKAGDTLPSPRQEWAEHQLNAFPFATILFMANLTLGFVLFFITLWRMRRVEEEKSRFFQTTTAIGYVLMLLSFGALSYGLALRWIVTGNVPMSNGYETMLAIAWFVELVTLLAAPKIRIVLTFGFVLSGFFLLVSHIGQMNPAITNLMPVLNSPLLSVHVSVIMMSYALLGLTFFCGLTAFLLRIRKEEEGRRNTDEALKALSQLFLCPALVCLGIGIFVGAIWANVSWGRYWGWDPKEVWALITFMVYALPMYEERLPWLRKPLGYHIYIVCAFATALMTYFGVNYLLGGMHSYA